MLKQAIMPDGMSDMQHGDSKQLLHQRREEGRLSTAALRSLFQDVHHMEQNRSKPDLAALSKK